MDAPELTRTQQDVLDVFLRYVAANGAAPTVRVVAAQRCRSISATHAILLRLVDHGHLIAYSEPDQRTHSFRLAPAEWNRLKADICDGTVR